MSHQISFVNGKAEMAYVGALPWWGGGSAIQKGATIEQCLKAAHMEWEAKSGTPQILIPGGTTDDPFDVLEFEAYKGLYRSDDLRPLGIVGADYNEVQPRQCVEFFRDMVESNTGWYIHTLGCLKGGRKIWCMATNDQMQVVGKKPNNFKKFKAGQTDEVRNNLLLATSLDGSMRTLVVDTPVRVVCWNTMQAAFANNEGMVAISHRSVFDGDAVKRALGLAPDTFERFIKMANELAETPIDVSEARAILNKVFKVEEKQAKKPDTSWLGALADLGNKPVIQDDSRVVNAVLNLFEGNALGADLASAKGTRWGLLNAVTEHVDHHMGRTEDTRLDAAWFGRGNGFKNRAFELLTTAEA